MSSSRSRNSARILILLAIAALAIFRAWTSHPSQKPEPDRPKFDPTDVVGLPIPPSEERLDAHVVEVLDGDSMKVQIQGFPNQIRLFGIDAPEGNTRQPFAEEARAEARRLCNGKDVEIVVRDTDPYGRRVSDVYLPDGRRLQELMVEAGLAWHYRRFAPDDQTLANLQKEARAADRGLWSDPDPMPPWTWRREHPQPKRKDN